MATAVVVRQPEIDPKPPEAAAAASQKQAVADEGKANIYR